MIHGHGGDVYRLAERLRCRPEAILDLSSNVNPLGPPPGLEDHLRSVLPSIARLPEADAGSMVRTFSDFHNIPESRIISGNGTTELIYQIPRALGSRRALILGPTYSDYWDACRMEGIESRFHFAREAEGFVVDMEAFSRDAEPCDTVFICNPNNPTGQLISPDQLKAFCRQFPEKRLIIDESYLPFVPRGENASLMETLPQNALVLHSMSKIFRVPGLRIGFLVAGEQWIEKMRRLALPWSVNSLAQAAVARLLGEPDSTRDFIARCQRLLAEEIVRLVDTLDNAVPGLKVYPTVTSFMLIRLPDAWTAERVWEAMAEKGILVRNCANFEGLSERFIRISVQSPEVNQRAAHELIRLLRTE